MMKLNLKVWSNAPHSRTGTVPLTATEIALTTEQQKIYCELVATDGLAAANQWLSDTATAYVLAQMIKVEWTLIVVP